MAGKGVAEITEANFQAEVLDSGQAWVLDFWAPWCGPCIHIGPLIEQLAGQFQGQVNVGKVNVDNNQTLARQFRITSIPAIVGFKGGEEFNRVVGANPKKISDMFDELL